LTMPKKPPPGAVTDAEREDRRRKVATLLLANRTQTEIAQLLGVSRQTVNYDVKAIRDEWRAERIEAYERYRAEDMKRLEALERALWPDAMQGKWLAIDRILAIISQRAKLLGTEAPQRSTVTVITEDLVDAEIRRLEAQLGEFDGSVGGSA